MAQERRGSAAAAAEIRAGMARRLGVTVVESRVLPRGVRWAVFGRVVAIQAGVAERGLVLDAIAAAVLSQRADAYSVADVKRLAEAMRQRKNPTRYK